MGTFKVTHHMGRRNISNKATPEGQTQPNQGHTVRKASKATAARSFRPAEFKGITEVMECSLENFRERSIVIIFFLSFTRFGRVGRATRRLRWRPWRGG